MGRVPRAVAWRRGVLAACLLAFAGMGCSPSTLWFLMRGDDKKAPDYPLPPKDGKKEVSVAVLVGAAPGMGVEFAGVDRELAALIGKKLADETKDSKHPIKVVEAAKVDKLKAGPGGWKDPAVVGKQAGADYVLDVTVMAMSMYQPEYGREFYQGRANLNVVVYDTAKPDKPVQDYPHNSIQPQKSTAAVNPGFYQRGFVERLAEEVAHRHIPHVAMRALPPVQ